MNIGLFGGTFDPIHNGHLAVARAAAERCKLGKVLFVPSDIPPHKREQPVTEFIHRYAMVALALQGEKGFFPSLLEASQEKYPAGENRIHYSIDTVTLAWSSPPRLEHAPFEPEILPRTNFARRMSHVRRTGTAPKSR